MVKDTITKKLKTQNQVIAFIVPNTKKIIGCKKDVCPYLLDRAALGAIGYNEIVKEVFKNISDCRFKKRINKLIKSGNKFMFLNLEHSYRFYEITKKLNKKTPNKYITVIYLLSTSANLYKQMSIHINKNDIDFDNVKLSNLITDNYVFYQMAKSIYLEKPTIKFEELIDDTVIEDNVFKILIDSILVNICGKEILYFH